MSAQSDPQPDGLPIFLFIRLDMMRIPPALISQRKFRAFHSAYLQANMDLDKIGTFTANFRDGFYYLVDGQHRRDALLKLFGDPGLKVPTRVYYGLSKTEESDLFLGYNNRLAVHPFERFVIAVEAQHADETAIAGVLQECGCTLSQDTGDYHVAAVGALLGIYSHHGPDVLARTLRVVGDGLGGTAYHGDVLTAIAAVLGRYGDRLDDAHLVHQLLTMRSGLQGLQQAAALIRTTYGVTAARALPAAIVDRYNRGLGSRSSARLAAWFTLDMGETP